MRCFFLLFLWYKFGRAVFIKIGSNGGIINPASRPLTSNRKLRLLLAPAKSKDSGGRYNRRWKQSLP